MSGRLVVTVRDNPRNGSLAHQVFQSVKREIVECRLQPGAILTEGALAEQFGVSRAPAREALKRLAGTGLVRAVPRVGYIVSALSLHDFDEIFAVRILIEPFATELAVPRITSTDATRLRELAEWGLDLQQLPASERGTILTQSNADFHREVARIGGNQRLERTITGLIDELERLMYMLAFGEEVNPVMPQHIELVDLMCTGDAVAAGRLMGEQLEQDYELMRALATRAPGSHTPPGSSNAQIQLT